jgi:hypothetical protein
MISARTLVIAGAALIAVTALTGCGEKEQVIVYQQGKYQGKPDGKPWDNESLGEAKWTKGDKVSWEAEIKQRNQSQNEYKRIDQ